MLRAGASYSFHLSLNWAASWGDLIGFTGCAALRGGTTLGDVAVCKLAGVASDAGLGGRADGG